MIPTVPVTVTFFDQNGHPLAGGKVSAILTRDELYQGFVVPNQLTVTSDAAGIVKWRGFKGTYRLSAGATKTAPIYPGSANSPVGVRVP